MRGSGTSGAPLPWDRTTMEIAQKAFIESILNHFGGNSSSDIPATPVCN